MLTKLNTSTGNFVPDATAYRPLTTGATDKLMVSKRCFSGKYKAETHYALDLGSGSFPRYKDMYNTKPVSGSSNIAC